MRCCQLCMDAVPKIYSKTAANGKKQAFENLNLDKEDNSLIAKWVFHWPIPDKNCHNFNLIKVLFCSHPNSNRVVITKFCMMHQFCCFSLCKKLLVIWQGRNLITRFFHQFKLRWKACQWSGPRIVSIRHCTWISGMDGLTLLCHWI